MAVGVVVYQNNDQDHRPSALHQPLVRYIPHVGRRNRSSLAQARHCRDEQR